jgi:tubulin alpha
VPGNEQADELAKAAAKRKLAAPGARTLAAAVRPVTRRKTLDLWDRQWQVEAHGRDLFWHAGHPDKIALRRHKGLSRVQSSILTQLRTGKIGLNHFLYNIGVKEEALCRCRRSAETIRHVLTECHLLHNIREEVFGPSRGRGLDVRQLISHPDVVSRTTSFMQKADRLKQFRWTSEQEAHRPVPLAGDQR